MANEGKRRTGSDFGPGGVEGEGVVDGFAIDGVVAGSAAALTASADEIVAVMAFDEVVAGFAQQGVS